MMNFILLLLTVTNTYAFGPKKPVSTPTPIPSASPTTTPIPTPAGGQWWKTPNGADLRPCDNGIIEAQETPYCTAFGLAAILTEQICKKERYSVGHIFSFYRQYSVDAAANSVPGNKITLWPYWGEYAKHGTVDYMDFAEHQITGMDYIDTDDNLGVVMKELDEGRPVYLGFQVPSDLASCYSNVRKTSRTTRGGHAVAVMGYGLDKENPDNSYLILKNSWGKDCHDNGYAYYSFGFIESGKGYHYFYKIHGVK